MPNASVLESTLTQDHLVQAFLTRTLFNLIKHPLSRFPGPRIWACSRLPYVLYLQNGTLHAKIKALHDIYGPVVRVAPNELSFIKPEAWTDIYCDKPHGFRRGKTFYGMLGKNSVFGAGHDDHARIRGAVIPAFRASAIQGYEEKLRAYVDLLMEQLGVLTKNKACGGRFDRVGQDEVVVDIIRWLNFTTFDIIGNFVYGGEPFGCLKRGEFHPWVGLIFVWLEALALAVSIQFYTPLDRVLQWLVPSSLMKQMEEFDRLGRDRVRKRMLNADDELDTASPSDVLSHLKSRKSRAIMTLAEMEVTLPHIIIAGSETVATTLSGTINYLCQNPVVLETLTDEVRSAAPHEADLTLANLTQLPYLTAVLKEGLRVISPVPVSFPRIVPAEGAIIADCWVPGHVSLIHLFVSSPAAHPHDNKNAQLNSIHIPCALPPPSPSRRKLDKKIF